jgi:hypothetical protein
LLVINAPDASLGGAAERVFSGMLEDALARRGEWWSVVASIRMVDLKNRRRVRDIMRGSPSDPRFSEPDLERVRHFRVPRLSDAEIAAVSAANSDLRDLFANAPPLLKELLRSRRTMDLSRLRRPTCQGARDRHTL